MQIKKIALAAVLAASGLFITSCGRQVTRVSTEETIDLSGRWNNSDSREVAQQMTRQVLDGAWIGNFQDDNDNKKPVVIVGMVYNKSHEHIDAETFVKDVEQSFYLLMGVLAGMAVSFFFLLLGNVRKAFAMEHTIVGDQKKYTLTLAQEVSFLNKTAIKNKLDQLPDNCELAIRAKQMSYIHIDVVELIQTFINEKAKEKNICITTTGFHKSVQSNEGESNIILSHRKSI